MGVPIMLTNMSHNMECLLVERNRLQLSSSRRIHSATKADSTPESERQVKYRGSRPQTAARRLGVTAIDRTVLSRSVCRSVWLLAQCQLNIGDSYQSDQLHG